jgi:ubiquinone/menaquinone biosynthesis C-methylase UbiE
METYYATRAPEYDNIYLKPERQADLREIEQWLPAKCAKANVIEIACGTGYWTQFIAPLAKKILAIDSAPETLSIAKNRVTQSNVEFQTGDAYALPQHTDKFDVGFAGFWFSHVPIKRQREFLQGLRATLNPGSKVVLLDNRYVQGSSSSITERDDEGNTYQTRILSNGTTHRVLKNFPTEKELNELLTGLGTSVTLTTWQYYWALEYVAI